MGIHYNLTEHRAIRSVSIFLGLLIDNHVVPAIKKDRWGTERYLLVSYNNDRFSCCCHHLALDELFYTMQWLRKQC